MSYYKGTMHVVGEKKSYDRSKSQDIFNIKGPETEDHIWPLSRNGSNSSENIQYLTKVSNSEKSYELKGYINDVRYAVLQKGTKDDKVIGEMFVSYDGGVTWYLSIK